MIEDITIYFDNGDEDEFTTSQQYIGFRELFRGYIVKDWVGSNFNCDKYNELNKVVIKHIVRFYNKCWRYRNNEFHDKAKQRNRFIN